MEIPTIGRATIIEDFDYIEIIIPAKKNWLLILFLGFWIGGWLFGEITVNGTLVNIRSGSLDFFTILWLCGWTLGGAVVIRTLIWSLFGKEIITVDRGTITIDKKGAIFYKAKTYELNEAKHFRSEEENFPTDNFGNKISNPFNLDKLGTMNLNMECKLSNLAIGLMKQKVITYYKSFAIKSISVNFYLMRQLHNI